MKPIQHHATLIVCRECARLKLGQRMARTQAEKDKWQRLIDAHLTPTPVPTVAHGENLQQGHII
jgi:hypothetical protein